MLVDTHCHLDFNSFDLDRQDVIRRAREAGVRRILNPGIDLRSSQEAVRLSEIFPEVFAAVGVHPNEADTWDEISLEILKKHAAHPRVLAIGEIGLDYYRDRVSRSHQRQVFLAQLDLAFRLDLPVIIHNREAHADLLPILERWVEELRTAKSSIADRPGVLHSFSGDAYFATRAIATGFYLGFSGPVTFKNAGELQAIVQSIPADRILTETDAPFLAPHPHRGQRNEPAHVSWIARKIAELRKTDENQIINETASNAARLFCW